MTAHTVHTRACMVNTSRLVCPNAPNGPSDIANVANLCALAGHRHLMALIKRARAVVNRSCRWPRSSVLRCEATAQVELNSRAFAHSNTGTSCNWLSVRTLSLIELAGKTSARAGPNHAKSPLGRHGVTAKSGSDLFILSLIMAVVGDIGC